MKINLLLVCLLALLAALGCASLSGRHKRIDPLRSPFAPANQSATRQQILEKVGAPSPKWKELRFEKFENNTVDMVIDYAEKPLGADHSEAKYDTLRVADAALKVLVARGADADDLKLTVHARVPASGENEFRNIGRTDWIPGVDGTEFIDE